MAKGRSRGWRGRPAILAVIRGFSMDMAPPIAERRLAGIVPATVWPCLFRLEQGVAKRRPPGLRQSIQGRLQCRRSRTGRAGEEAAYDGAGESRQLMIAAIVRTASVLAVLLVTGCSFYLAEPRVPKTDLRASLNGSNEVPPTQSRGSGYFEAVYRPSTKVMEYRLNLVGLSGPITMGYMHGPAGPARTRNRSRPSTYRSMTTPSGMV